MRKLFSFGQETKKNSTYRPLFMFKSIEGINSENQNITSQTFHVASPRNSLLSLPCSLEIDIYVGISGIVVTRKRLKTREDSVIKNNHTYMYIHPK